MSLESSAPKGAVFLSYASQDSEAAKRIVDALRGAGVEVWFDADGGLEHGDEWDAKIRRQIKECVLFIPVISANTQAREEGYFRLEWDMAVERARSIASGVPFILPVAIDDTKETGALVPDRFCAVQWTRLAGGHVTPDVLQRFLKLWSHRTGTLKHQQAVGASLDDARPAAPEPGRRRATPLQFVLATLAFVVVAAALFFVLRPRRSPEEIAKIVADAQKLGQAAAKSASPPEGASSPMTAHASPDVAADKSVAVLAFANLSDDKANEYFSDGISEELLNVLAKVPGLTVRGRSSGFYFKGKQVTSAEIGRQLAVGYLVQGSVRRAGDRVRITAQLIRAATDEVLWSSGALDRELRDIFAVQDEIARLIVQNLQLKLGDARALVKAVDPEAHRLVLEGRHYLALRGDANFALSEAAFRAAVKIAPDLAVAHVGLAELVAQRGRYQQAAGLAAPGSQLEEVQRHATRALELDPSLAEPHAALAVALVDAGRLADADTVIARGIAANPNYGSQYMWRSHVYAARGRLDSAIDDLRLATELDPLSFVHLWIRGANLGYAGRWAEALPLLDRGAALRGERFLPLEGERALVRFELGRRDEAMALARSILEDPEVVNLGWWSLGEALWILRQGGAEAEAVRRGDELLAKLTPENYLRGYVLCCLGRFDEGLPRLRQVPTIARNRLYYLPILDPARDTPAFKQLFAALKLEQEYAVGRATVARMKSEASR